MMGLKKYMKKALAFVLLICMMFTVVPINSVQAATSVKLNKTKLSMNAGDTYQLKLTGASKVSWSTSNKKIAIVSSKGVVSAIDTGNATITAKNTKTGKTYKCKVSIKNTMKLDKKSVFVEGIGESKSIKLLNSKSTTYKSWNTKIATVDKNGKIKGVAPGTCTVVAVNNVTQKVFKCEVTVALGSITYNLWQNNYFNMLYSQEMCNYVYSRFHIKLNDSYQFKVYNEKFEELNTDKDNEAAEIIIPFGNKMVIQKEGTYWLLISGKYWLKIKAERNHKLIQSEFLPKEIDYSSFDNWLSSAKNASARRISDIQINFDYYAEDNAQFGNCVINKTTKDELKKMLYNQVKDNIFIFDESPYPCMGVDYNYADYELEITYYWDDNNVIDHITYVLKRAV